MVTLADALIASWNGADWGTGGGGGTEPTFYNTEDIASEPEVVDATGWICVRGWSQRTVINRKTLNHVRKEHYMDVLVKTADATNKEERLDEVLNELNFLVTENVPTGYNAGEVVEIDRNASDKRYGIYGALVTIVTIENLADSATSPGAGSGAGTTLYSLICTGTAEFQDTVKNPVDDKGFYTGVGDDLRIYHDGTNSFIDNDTGLLIIPSASSIYLRPSGDDDDYLMIRTVGGHPNIKVIGGGTLKFQTDGGSIHIAASNDNDDYWYFSTAANVASILPVEDKVHYIGSASLSADHIYSDDFDNTSPFKKFSKPCDEIKKIKDKDGKIDYESMPDFVRSHSRDPAKHKWAKRTVIDEETGEEIEEDYIIERAPKDVIEPEGWSVNRMVVLQWQAIQELTARIEELEANP